VDRLVGQHVAIDGTAIVNNAAARTNFPIEITAIYAPPSVYAPPSPVSAVAR
jgi:hypothetical protein